MEHLLARKLYDYLCRNSPDIILRLDDKGMNEFIRSKIENALPLLENLLVQNCPAFIIEELCMDQMTEDLKPSKYHYIVKILEEEFEEKYNGFKETGLLTYEITNMIDRCKEVFEKFRFSVLTEEDRQLYYAVTGIIGAYFEEPLNTGVHGL
ncbi:MAG: DUF1896 family protein [Chitinophagaceae bacterium]|nr:MAG: DUF1896 family protein [Chitinophagaceae bacterium]